MLIIFNYLVQFGMLNFQKHLSKRRTLLKRVFSAAESNGTGSDYTSNNRKSKIEEELEETKLITEISKKDSVLQDLVFGEGNSQRIDIKKVIQEPISLKKWQNEHNEDENDLEEENEQKK